LISKRETFSRRGEESGWCNPLLGDTIGAGGEVRWIQNRSSRAIPLEKRGKGVTVILTSLNVSELIWRRLECPSISTTPINDNNSLRCEQLMFFQHTVNRKMFRKLHYKLTFDENESQEVSPALAADQMTDT
jgi:hypothetical protein